MEIEKAISIIKALSEGIDPYTGEQYSPESPYQMPDTVRALHMAVMVLEKHQKTNLRQQDLPRSAGKPWNDDEDKHLIEAYDTGTPIKEISELHDRTVGAIRSRLVKHGRIKNS